MWLKIWQSRVQLYANATANKIPLPKVVLKIDNKMKAKVKSESRVTNANQQNYKACTIL